MDIRFADSIKYGNRDLAADIEDAAHSLVEVLRQGGLSFSAAESCTGGMIAAAVTDIAGASEVFGYGFVTYSAAAKQQLLGVEGAELERYGVVSIETARSMAFGALRVSGADVAVAVTGVAGPGGGTEQIPVGTVCIGSAVRLGETITATAAEYRFAGDRHRVRQQTVLEALSMALRYAETVRKYYDVDGGYDDEKE